MITVYWIYDNWRWKIQVGKIKWNELDNQNLNNHNLKNLNWKDNKLGSLKFEESKLNNPIFGKSNYVIRVAKT